MNPIEEQTEIIGKLASLMHRSAADGYDEASCVFEYLTSDDGSVGVREKFHYTHHGEIKSIHMRYERDVRSGLLVPRLHQIMLAHTGGAWTEFTLTLDKSGKATTKFKYPESESLILRS